MARPLRIEYPGALYHVMNRGNSEQDLFRTTRDRERFLECLDTAVERFSLKIHAYKERVKRKPYPVIVFVEKGAGGDWIRKVSSTAIT